MTYSKPFSMSCVASFVLVAVLQVYSSVSLNAMSCVYSMVVSIFLCPSLFLVAMMSFVLA